MVPTCLNQKGKVAFDLNLVLSATRSLQSLLFSNIGHSMFALVYKHTQKHRHAHAISYEHVQRTKSLEKNFDKDQTFYVSSSNTKKCNA